MDKAKILRECTRIEEIVTDAYNQHRGLNYYDVKEVVEKAREIGAEVSAQPKSNADRIRQMTDEELAEMVSMKVCRIVKSDGDDCQKGFYFGKCDKCVISWLRKEVSEDAGTD